MKHLTLGLRPTARIFGLCFALLPLKAIAQVAPGPVDQRLYMPITVTAGQCAESTTTPALGAWATCSGGGGGVSSVGLTAPSVFTVTGSPVTSSGTLAIIFATGQTANEFLATPNGSSGALSLRAIVAADIPTLNQNTTGTSGGLSGSPAITVSSCTGCGGATLQSNGTNNTSQTLLNLEGGSGIAVTNPSGGLVVISPISNPLTYSAATESLTCATINSGSLTNTYTGSATWTLPTTGTSGCGVGFAFDIQNNGTGTLTLSSSSNINGAATLPILPGYSCSIFTDVGGTFYNVSACLAVVPTITYVSDTGPKPTITGTGACSSITSPHGGAAGGQFTCSGTTGTATITIPMPATEYWSCWMNDTTTVADSPLKQTTNGSVASVSFSSAATASGDIINYGCSGSNG